MLKFHSIASGSGGNCYLLTDADHSLMIECGIRYKSIQQGMWNLRRSVAGLDGLLCSHKHGDHAKSLKDIMTAGIDCWASEETFGALMTCHSHVAHIASPRRAFNIKEWQVVPFESEHDEAGSLAFIIMSPCGDSLAYVIDSCYIRYKLPSVNILAIEVNHSVKIVRENVEAGRLDKDLAARILRTHMSLERAVDLFKANDLSKVREIFLLHLSSDNSDAALFRETVERATGIPTKVCAERTQ